MKENSNRNETIQQQGDSGKRYAILVLDMLNDFIHGKLKCEGAQKIIPNVQLLIKEARNKRIPIFFCNDEHLPVDAYEMDLWGPHAMKDTQGSKVIDELKPNQSDYIIPKRRYSAFDETPLYRALKEAYGGKGANTVILTGVHTHICATHTAYDAFVRNLDIVVAEDGVNAFNEEDHAAGLDYMKRIYGAKIKRVADIIKSF
jgi:nicotinamidase-related amidase